MRAHRCARWQGGAAGRRTADCRHKGVAAGHFIFIRAQGFTGCYGNLFVTVCAHSMAVCNCHLRGLGQGCGVTEAEEHIALLWLMGALRHGEQGRERELQAGQYSKMLGRRCSWVLKGDVHFKNVGHERVWVEVIVGLVYGVGMASRPGNLTGTSLSRKGSQEQQVITAEYLGWGIASA